ncbi:MAG: hypothetical protein ACJ8F7_17570 [Gemmataceae bacterium]
MSGQREVYVPSGHVNWPKLAVGFAIGLPFALLSGYLLGQAIRSGVYLPVAVPLVAAVPAAGAVWFTVWLGACRNRWVGAAVGLTIGVIAFLSCYQFDLAHSEGIEHLYRVDELPDYIPRRVAADSRGRFLADVRPPGRAPLMNRRDSRQTGVGVNLFLFALDGLTVLFLAMWNGWGRAKWPYSEQHRRWLHEYRKDVERRSAERMAELLEEEDPVALADAVEPSKFGVTFDQYVLRLYYIPLMAESPVYLSLSLRQGVVSWRLWGKKLVPLVRLTPAEGAELIEQLRPPGARVAEVLEAQPIGEAVTSGAASATIEELPPDEAANVIHGKSLALLVALEFLPLIVGLLIIIALVILLILTWSIGPARAALGLGILATLVGSFVVAAKYSHHLPMVLLQRRIAAAIRRRAAPLVNPDDPAAMYVGVIPRANWGKVKLMMTDDVGFLKVDAARRAIHFEGDGRRWTVPAESIESCELEEFILGIPDPKETNVYAVAVLRANVGGRIWEAPLSPARVSVHRARGAERRRMASRLIQQIRTELLARRIPTQLDRIASPAQDDGNFSGSGPR